MTLKLFIGINNSMNFKSFYENFIKKDEPYLDYTFDKNKFRVTVAWRLNGYKTQSPNVNYPYFNDQISYVVLEKGDRIPNFPDDLMFIANSGTDEKYQRQGYGLELYNYAVKISHKLGYKGIASDREGRSTNANKIWNKIPHEEDEFYSICYNEFM
jgi:ribosomal protein S18 acetylase RimI-like enzyme